VTTLLISTQHAWRFLIGGACADLCLSTHYRRSLDPNLFFRLSVRLTILLPSRLLSSAIRAYTPDWTYNRRFEFPYLKLVPRI